MKTSDAIWNALRKSWPPVNASRRGGFLWQDGALGGKRVNAAHALGPVSQGDLENLEHHFEVHSRVPLFQISPEDTELDSILAQRGYGICDATVCFSAPLEHLLGVEQETIPAQWPPTAGHRDQWARAGIGVDRLAVMERACAPKAVVSLEGGLAFVAVHDSVAAIHALEVTPEMRRRGVATRLIAGAAQWAKQQDAQVLALLVTTQNKPAIALYSSLGMQESQGYHYRMKGSQ